MPYRYEMLTGIQILVSVLFLCTALQFRTAQKYNIFHFAAVPFLYSLWCGIILYYSTSFIYLTLLWAMVGLVMGGFLGWFFLRDGAAMKYYPARRALFFPDSYRMGALIVAGVFFLWALQAVSVVAPVMIRHWNFNELLGFLIGTFAGLFWGAAASLLNRMEYVDESTHNALSSHS